MFLSLSLTLTHGLKAAQLSAYFYCWIKTGTQVFNFLRAAMLVGLSLGWTLYTEIICVRSQPFVVLSLLRTGLIEGGIPPIQGSPKRRFMACADRCTASIVLWCCSKVVGVLSVFGLDTCSVEVLHAVECLGS